MIDGHYSFNYCSLMKNKDSGEGSHSCPQTIFFKIKRHFNSKYCLFTNLLHFIFPLSRYLKQDNIYRFILDYNTLNVKNDECLDSILNKFWTVPKNLFSITAMVWILFSMCG